MDFSRRRAERVPNRAISRESELSVFDWRAHVKIEKVSKEVEEIMDRIVVAFAKAPSEETDEQMVEKIELLEKKDKTEISDKDEKDRNKIKNRVFAMIWWAEDKRIIKAEERLMLQPAMFEIM